MDSYADYADLYDLEYARLIEDIDFYLRHALETGSPVLELGAGSGRVAIPLARAGLEVWALDSSAAMLDRLRARLAHQPEEVAARIRPVEADMSRFALDRKFRLIIAAFHSFMHLLEPESQRAALACIKRHLHPEGRLLINVFSVDPGRVSSDAPFRRQPGWDFQDGSGNRVLASAAYSLDWPRRRIQQDCYYETLDSRGRVQCRRHVTLVQRAIDAAEMNALLLESGLTVETIFGGFHGDPAGPEDTELTWCARPLNPRELEARAAALMMEVRAWKES